MENSDEKEIVSCEIVETETESISSSESNDSDAIVVTEEKNLETENVGIVSWIDDEEKKVLTKEISETFEEKNNSNCDVNDEKTDFASSENSDEILNDYNEDNIEQEENIEPNVSTDTDLPLESDKSEVVADSEKDSFDENNSSNADSEIDSETEKIDQKEAEEAEDVEKATVAKPEESEEHEAITTVEEEKSIAIEETAEASEKIDEDAVSEEVIEEVVEEIVEELVEIEELNKLEESADSMASVECENSEANENNIANTENIKSVEEGLTIQQSLEPKLVTELGTTVSVEKPLSVIEELDKLKTNKKDDSETSNNDEESSSISFANSSEMVAAIEEAIEGIKEDSPEETPKTDEAPNIEESPIVDENKILRSKRRIDFLKSFFFDLVFICLCCLFVLVLFQKWLILQNTTIKGTNQVHSSLESGEKTSVGNINILVMGIDSVEGTHRSDTIFVLGVNPSKNKITMLSIPRDTRVIIENKARKINEILPRYGEATLRKIIENLLKITISRKAEVGFESFIGVIDALGGVDINIAKPMNYDDNWGNLHIHFNAGPNHLDGKNALNYVRFRKDAMADLGRIKRQQEFVKAVIKKLMSPTNIVKLPSIIENVFHYMKTDFTLQEILTLANGFNGFDVKLTTLSLPGEARYVDKISFFMPYSEQAVMIGNSYFSDLSIFEIEKNYNLGRVIPKKEIPSRKNK